MIELENDFWKLSVLPEIGAKIYDLTWKPSGRSYLWHNPRIQPQPYPIDSNFDNYWCGGWDEIFPTADACEHKGEPFPNCGELRSLHWREDHRAPGEVALSCFGPISPIRATRRIRLSGRELQASSEIENLGPGKLDFLWGSHPAIAVSAGDRLRIPAKTGLVSLSSGPAMGLPGQTYAWPRLGETDMSVVQPITANVSCGHYALDLEEGWFAIEGGSDGSGIRFSFALDKCPCLWMWIVYGAWRGYHHVIIEPWTGYPVNLAEAVKNNRHQTLDPGERFEVTISVSVYP